MQNLNKIIDL